MSRRLAASVAAVAFLVQAHGVTWIGCEGASEEWCPVSIERCAGGAPEHWRVAGEAFLGVCDGATLNRSGGVQLVSCPCDPGAPVS